MTVLGQLPAPNSKEFTGPADRLKGLLWAQVRSPETALDHACQIQDWFGEHPGFLTYLQPQYGDALKGYLGSDLHAHFIKVTTEPMLSPQEVTDKLKGVWDAKLPSPEKPAPKKR